MLFPFAGNRFLLTGSRFQLRLRAVVLVYDGLRYSIASAFEIASAERYKLPCYISCEIGRRTCHL
jgi:hypothetical protein